MSTLILILPGMNGNKDMTVAVDSKKISKRRLWSQEDMEIGQFVLDCVSNAGRYVFVQHN